MIYTYKITLKHHFFNARGIIIFTGFALLFPLLMEYRFGPDNLYVFIRYSVVGFCSLLIPQLIIHLRFYLLDKGRIFIYNPTSQKMAIKVDSIKYEFTFDEIETIERYKSFPLAENRMHWFPWDNYNYSVINLKNGQCFLVTSLLVPNLDLPISSEKIKLRKRFYCYPSKIKENLIPEVE